MASWRISRCPFGLAFVLAMIVGSLLAGFLSVLIERLAFRPLRRRGADRLLSLVSSLGVAIVIVNLIQYLVGAEIYTYKDRITGSLPVAVNFGSEDNPDPDPHRADRHLRRLLRHPGRADRT